MKKIIIIAIAAVMSLGAAAENLYIGGSLGFWRNADKNTTDLTILPEIGYKLSDKWAVGAELGYGYTYDSNKSWNAGVLNPYARFSFFDNEKIVLFCDGQLGMQVGRNEFDGHAVGKVGFNWSLGLRPGIAYNVTDKFSLVAHTGFLGYKGRSHYGSSDREGGLALDLTKITFGFYVNF